MSLPCSLKKGIPNKRSFLSVSLLLILCVVDLYAIQHTTILSGQSAGMGGNGVALPSVWSNHTNPSLLAHIKNPVVGLHFENRFFEQTTSTRSIATAIPLKGGSFGFNYSLFGYSRFNESKTGIAFGKKLSQHLSAGIQINYHHTFIAEQDGGRRAFSAEAGLAASPLKNLTIGFHVFNPTGHSPEELPLPVISRLGAAYLLQDKSLLAVEVEKEIDQKPVLKIGAEHKVFEFLPLRFGVTTLSSQYTFGMGLLLEKTILDIAFVSHRELGYSPHLSVCYVF